MKISHKIIAANGFHIVLMAAIFFFAYLNLNMLLAKLRFVQIADDLKADFLEIRLLEKNYFLYYDASNLLQIKKKLANSLHYLSSGRVDTIRAIGLRSFEALEGGLQTYINSIEKAKKGDIGTEINIREAGRRLTEVLRDATRVERQKVNHIISIATKGLFYSFCAIILLAIGMSNLIFANILRSLKKIERAAHAISKGNFEKVEERLSRDELGSVIEAINSMSGELKNREEQILQSKRLASLGVLTAGVAHELGNPLNNISMIAQAYIELYDKLVKDDRIAYMKQVEEETERIQEIVQNLLDFSKPKKADFQEADINRVIERSMKLVNNMIHISGIETKLDLQDGLPPVFIDENKIQEVLVNLITNAVQAMSPGGELSLVTRSGDEEGYVVVEVGDTGNGIAPEILPHIFDPFFSTKGTGGTGLGLSVSFGIIKNHKGNMRVESEVGVGTNFVIELPVYKGEEIRDERSQNHGD